MENLDDNEVSTKSRRISRAVDVAVEIEETPLLNPNISETIQPSMTVLLRSKLETMLDIQYQTGDFGYMECEPSPPDQSASSIYESLEELNTELSVQICSDTLRSSLINEMKNVEGIGLLEDIEQGKITAENIPQFFVTSSELEKKFAFLWSAFLKRSDLLEELLSIGAGLNFCDQNGFSALHLAAFSGCLPSTRFLISKQMEVNMQPNYFTPLHCAAFGNSVETAKILLDNGALISIDTKTPSYEQSLLHCAVRANSLDCVKLFIEAGSDVNSLEPNGTNAIHLAAHLGNARCLEALLNAPGADPDTRISIPGKESTALHLAADKGYVECIKLLLAKGGDSNLKNHWGLTALHLAARKSSLECVKLLLEKGNADPNAEDFYHRTPLHAVVGKSKHAFDILETLISFGANVNHQDRYGFTAIHLAALDGLARCLEALAKAPDADPNIGICTFVKDSTALHFAAGEGNVECVNLLLDKGADSNLKNDWGVTALHLAARKSCLECVSSLLKKGNANVNHQDKNGVTALHLAAYYGPPRSVDMLIYFGADVTIKSKSGITALKVITRQTPNSIAIIRQKFDEATTLNRSQDNDNRDVELKLNFCELLRDSHPHEISYLNAFVDEGRNEILEHPLCSAFLYIKWKKIQRYYIFNLMIYFSFVLLLTLYVLNALTAHCFNGSNDDNYTFRVFEQCQKKSILGDLFQVNSFVMKMQNCYNGSKDDNKTIQAKELYQKQSILGDLFQINSFVMKIQNCYNGSNDDNTRIQAEENCQKQSILGDLYQINSFIMKIQNCYNGSKNDNTTIQSQEQCQKQSLLGDLFQINSFVMKIQNCYNGNKNDNTTIQAQELCQKQSILGDLFQINTFVTKIQNCYNGSKDDNTTIQAQEQCQKQSIPGDLYQINSFVMKIQNCYNGSKDDNTTIQAEEECQKQFILGDLYQINSFVMKMQNCYNGSKDDNTTTQVPELCQEQSILGDLFQINSFIMKMQNCYNGTLEAQFCQRELKFRFWLLVFVIIPEIFRKVCGMTGYSSIWHCITQREFYLEWFVILSTFFMYGIHMNQTYTYHYPIGVLGVLVGWTNVMLKIGQLPVFTAYVAMYTKVLKEVAKLFIVYSCMLVLFTISFCVIFPSSSSFANPIVGFISVLLMMIGELDISLLLNDPYGKDSSVLLKIIGIITFVLFLFFVPITLMNLLVGIAVNDIQGLKKTAEQSKLVQQTKLIYYMESILFVDNQPTWLNKIIKHYLDSPEPCQEELCVKPFNLGEKKLPRDILMAAYEVAKKHENSGHTILPRCSETINFSDNNSQESVRLSRKSISTITPKNDDIVKHVEALTAEIKELKKILIQQHQQEK